MRWLFGVLAVTACGGGHAVRSDAQLDGSRADAHADAALDAPADVPRDAAVGPSWHVWVLGDVVEPGHVVASAFDEHTALPTTPTVIAPRGTASLMMTPRSSPATFDAVATRTAFIANLRDASVYDVYVADPDGQNPTLLVQGAAGIAITEVSLSPDGTKLVYVSNTAADPNGYDAYMVSTTGASAPVQVSPPRTQGINTFYLLSWSGDSRYLGMDDLALTTIGFGPMVVDTNAATPTAVAMLAPDQLNVLAPDGWLIFDSADRPYFRLRTVSTNEYDLYVADAGGTNPSSIVSRCSQYGVSRDGAVLTYSTDAAIHDTFEIYATSTATWNPAVIATTAAGTGAATAGQLMRLSDDHTVVTYMFVAGDSPSYRVNAFVAHTDGSGYHRILDAPQGSDAEVWGSAITHDGGSFYIIDDLGSGDTAYRVETDAVDGTPAQAIVPAAGGHATNLLIQP